MARLPRIDVPNLPHHIIQRGNNRAVCFFHDEDYRFYLQSLRQATQKYQCQVHAYVLMTNHVHLLVTGTKSGSISAFMQSLGRRYVRYVNQTYHRTGTLWEGRFKSSLIESDRYLLTCYRYIELNPIRAHLVTEPGAYTWSSYSHHGLGRIDNLIEDHELYMALGPTVEVRCEAYRSLCGEGVKTADLGAIRDHVNKGRVLGSSRFQSEIESMLQRRVRIQPVGRPPKRNT